MYSCRQIEHTSVPVSSHQGIEAFDFCIWKSLLADLVPDSTAEKAGRTVALHWAN
jgi:hypothetical protein